MRIGFIGLAGSGKDTAAAMLQVALADQGVPYTIDRYAAPLKKAVHTIFGDSFDDRIAKEKIVKVDPDVVIEASFAALRAARLTEDEMDKASELFFDHLGFYQYLSPRQYQQVFGTEVGRAVRSTIWSDRLVKSNRDLIVPDVRFGGELLDLNILIYRESLDRHGVVHSSEALATEMLLGFDDSYDAVISNRGTLEELRVEIETRIVPLILSKG